MDRDQAAAILGTAHNAYFDVPCDVCEGSGEIVDRDDPRLSFHNTYRDCPNCDGSGETGMPHPDTIVRAAKTLVGT